MSSLVPEEAIAELEAHLGERFHVLSDTERLALITASSEGVVNHARLREICAEHSADISKTLAHLVRDGFLTSDGAGRGMVYFLPWKKQLEDALFDLRVGTINSGKSDAVPPQLSSIPPELNAIPPQLGAIPPELLPQYLDWNELPPELQSELLELASPVRTKRRTSSTVLQQTILALCAKRYLGRRVLAYVLKRNADDLLKRTLTPMVTAKVLVPAFASASDPRQAYMAVNQPTEQSS
jgi:hypothetical protein